MINVLLAETTETIHKIVDKYLDAEEYQLLSAYDGKETLHRLSEYKIEILIIAKELPVFSGLEVLKKIREDVNTIDTPVVMITSSSDQEFEGGLIEAGATALISKPFKKETLINILDDIKAKSNLGASVGDNANNRRREPRIQVEDYFSLNVVLRTPDLLDPAEVVDISKSGIRFINSNSSEFETGNVIPARLYINHKLYLPVDLTVVRIEKGGVACKIDKPKIGKQNPLDSFIEFLQISKDNVKTEDMGLVINRGDKKVKKLSLKRK